MGRDPEKIPVTLTTPAPSHPHSLLRLLISLPGPPEKLIGKEKAQVRRISPGGALAPTEHARWNHPGSFKNTNAWVSSPEIVDLIGMT